MPDTDTVSHARKFLRGEQFKFAEANELWKRLKGEDQLSLARQVLRQLREKPLCLSDGAPNDTRTREILCRQEALLTSKDPELDSATRHDEALNLLANEFEFIEDKELGGDEETLGIAGGICKRRWNDLGQLKDLVQAAEFYERAAKNELGDDAYPHINAAFLEDLLAAADRDSLKLNEIGDGYGASDHTSFYEKDVPVLHFFTNVHGDYHKPSDTWDKIDYPGIDRVAALVARVVDGVARRPGALTLRRGVGAPPRAEAAATPGYGAYLGTVPDFTPVEKGVKLSSVRAGSPAEAAGLWDELRSDWLLLDCELMPWSAKALELVRQQYAAANKERLFDELAGLLWGKDTSSNSDSYAAVGARLGMREGAVRVAMHRLRNTPSDGTLVRHSEYGRHRIVEDLVETRPCLRS